MMEKEFIFIVLEVLLERFSANKKSGGIPTIIPLKKFPGKILHLLLLESFAEFLDKDRRNSQTNNGTKLNQISDFRGKS